MKEHNNERLADRILVALTLSLEQKDEAISDLLGRALELALTRGTGGKTFVERRSLSEDVQGALTKLDKLHKSAKN